MCLPCLVTLLKMLPGLVCRYWCSSVAEADPCMVPSPDLSVLFCYVTGHTEIWREGVQDGCFTALLVARSARSALDNLAQFLKGQR